VSNKLRELSTTTDILDNSPEEEVMKLFQANSNPKKQKQKQNKQDESPS
jgi:hypothetical protein